MLNRKLHYDPLSPLKLSFEPKSSSMKKKPISGEGQPQVRAIKLFEVENERGLGEGRLLLEPVTPVGHRPSLVGVEDTPTKELGSCE